MELIRSIKFYEGTREELLPGFAEDFPYIATRAELDEYIGRFVPWHWHRSVELFYMESGTLEYRTPGGKWVFPAGSGGFVNSNVLHMTKAASQPERNIQFLHIFDPSFLAGERGSRIGQRYITPVTAASQVELIPLFPEDPEQEKILELVLRAFRLSGGEFGYEMKLREALSEIWLLLYGQAQKLPAGTEKSGKNDDRIKRMMVYIHEHYPEKIAVPELASSAFLSERECFRVFRDCLNLTPAEYIRSYRLQTACRMLAEGKESVTAISHACGLGSSSYFGKVFREYARCTPSEYRARWQDRDTKCQTGQQDDDTKCQAGQKDNDTKNRA